MKKCNHCGAEMNEDAAFCPHCGEPVTDTSTIQCSYCHQEVPADQLFCPHCGHRLLAGGRSKDEPQPSPVPKPKPEIYYDPKKCPPIPQEPIQTRPSSFVKPLFLYALICLLLTYFDALALAVNNRYYSFPEAFMIYIWFGLIAFIVFFIFLVFSRRTMKQASQTKDSQRQAKLKKTEKIRFWLGFILGILLLIGIGIFIIFDA